MLAAVPLEPSLSVLAWVQEEMRSSSQREHSQAAVLPAEPGTHLLLQDLQAGILAAVHRVGLLRQVLLTAGC